MSPVRPFLFFRRHRVSAKCCASESERQSHSTLQEEGVVERLEKQLSIRRLWSGMRPYILGKQGITDVRRVRLDPIVQASLPLVFLIGAAGGVAQSKGRSIVIVDVWCMG